MKPLTRGFYLFAYYINSLYASICLVIFDGAFMSNKTLYLAISLLGLAGCDDQFKTLYHPNADIFEKYVVPLSVDNDFLSNFLVEYASYNKRTYDITIKDINLSHDAFYQMNTNLVIKKTIADAKKLYCQNNKSSLYDLYKEDIEVKFTYKDKSSQSIFLSFTLKPSGCH